MSHREADGIIGPKTINKLMEKADSDFKLDVPHQNKAKNVTSKATAAKTAAPKATPDVSAAKAAAPKDTAPKAAAPKIEKSSASIEWINSDALKQSISDFNTYCSSHPLLKDRIIQDPD